MITKRQLTQGFPVSFMRNASPYERYLWYTFADILPANLVCFLGDCSLGDCSTQAHINYAMLQVKRYLLRDPENMAFSYLYHTYSLPLYFIIKRDFEEDVEIDPRTDYNVMPVLREKNEKKLGATLKRDWQKILDAIGLNHTVRGPETFGRTWFEIVLHLWLGYCELPIEGFGMADLDEKKHIMNKAREHFLAWNCAYSPFLAAIDISPRGRELLGEYEKSVNRFFSSLYFLAAFVYHNRDDLVDDEPLEAVIKNEAQLFHILTATPWQLTSFALARINAFVKEHS